MNKKHYSIEEKLNIKLPISSMQELRIVSDWVQKHYSVTDHNGCPFGFIGFFGLRNMTDEEIKIKQKEEKTDLRRRQELKEKIKQERINKFKKEAIALGFVVAKKG